MLGRLESGGGRDLGGLKAGAPRPRVRLPENFVGRDEAMAVVRGMLLGESGQTLVVSAIAGLGGLGKSVLATALVLDEAVQRRFEGLSEGEQRRSSLRACFNLSLKRLQPEQLRRFAWLGVLPEDARMARTFYIQDSNVNGWASCMR